MTDAMPDTSRFFVEDETVAPSGATKHLRAHGYGVTVVVYAHVEDFFPESDVPAAREALRHWLREERDDAKTTMALLSGASRAKLEALFDVGVAGMKPELLAEIASHAEDMKQVSPHGHLGGLRANVYLLHGEGDTVIPATETQWLAREVPPGRLRSALVSPAIEHVDLKNPSLGDKWALVHFMGRVLAEADEGGSR